MASYINVASASGASNDAVRGGQCTFSLGEKVMDLVLEVTKNEEIQQDYVNYIGRKGRVPILNSVIPTIDFRGNVSKSDFKEIRQELLNGRQPYFPVVFEYANEDTGFLEKWSVKEATLSGTLTTTVTGDNLVEVSFSITFDYNKSNVDVEVVD